jgi:hypothetical protein
MLEGLAPEVKIPPCGVRTAVDKLEPADQKILLEAVADYETWTANALMAALKRRGVTVGDKAIRKHREGVCSCSKI